MMQLADGEAIHIPGALTLAVKIGKPTNQHDFLIMLSLKSLI